MCSSNMLTQVPLFYHPQILNFLKLISVQLSSQVKKHTLLDTIMLRLKLSPLGTKFVAQPESSEAAGNPSLNQVFSPPSKW